MKNCPFCGGAIESAAVKCKHCRAWTSPPPPADSPVPSSPVRTYGFLEGCVVLFRGLAWVLLFGYPIVTIVIASGRHSYGSSDASSVASIFGGILLGVAYWLSGLLTAAIIELLVGIAKDVSALRAAGTAPRAEPLRPQVSSLDRP